MYLGKKILATSVGLATAAMLLAGTSSAFARPVTQIDRFSRTDDFHTAQSYPLTINIPHVLIMTGNGRAGSLEGESSAILSLVIINQAKPDEEEPCAADRMGGIDIIGFNLYTSASCVRLLEPGTYVLKAKHGVKKARRKKTVLDYVLIER